MKGLFGKIFHGKKTEAVLTYDKEKEKPVIRASICTGERVAGFRDLKTGRFRDVVLIRDQRDLDGFMKTYGIDSIDTEY